jgi:hypothetical protein
MHQVEMGAEVGLIQLIEGVIHTQKWVGVLTRNFVNAAVFNSQS